MRKFLTFTAAGLILAAVVLVTGCPQGQKLLPENAVSTGTDTVLTLGAPNVRAIAYPGVNYVTWEPVTGAEKYFVYRYDGNGWDKVAVKPYTDLSYKDVGRGVTSATPAADNTSLRNGVKYRYKVEAHSLTNNSTTRAVHVMNNMGESNEVTAIVPPIGTPVELLAAYENGWDGKTPKTAKDIKETAYQLSKDTLKTVYQNGNFIVEFPTKAYLEYEVVVKPEHYFDAHGKPLYKDLVAGDIAVTYEDINAQNNTVILEPLTRSFGTFKVMVRAKARKAAYGFVDVTGETLTVPELLEGKATQFVHLMYTEAHKARIAWVPAQDKDGKWAAASEYKVYRKRAASGYEPVQGTIIANAQKSVDKNADPVYVLEHDVPLNTVSYSYYLVHTKEENGVTLFGTGVSVQTLPVYTASGDASTAFVSAKLDILDNDQAKNDLHVIVTGIEKDTDKVEVHYAQVKEQSSVVDVNWINGKVLLSEWKPIELTDTVRGWKEGRIPNLEKGHYALRLYTERNGVKNVSVYSKTVDVTAAAVNHTTDELTLNAVLDSLDNDETANDLRVMVSDIKDGDVNELRYVKVATAKSSGVNLSWLFNQKFLTEMKTAELQADSIDKSKKAVTIKDLAEGSYVVWLRTERKDGSIDNTVYRKTLDIEAAAELALDISGLILSLTPQCEDKDGLTNDVLFKLTGDTKDYRIAVEYAFVGKNSPSSIGDSTSIEGAWTSFELTETNPTVPYMLGVKKDLPLGYYIARMKVANHADTQFETKYASSAVLCAPAWDTSDFEVTPVQLKDNESGKLTLKARVEVKDILEINDAIAQYTYTLRYAKVDTESFKTSGDSIIKPEAWKPVTKLTMHKTAEGVSGKDYLGVFEAAENLEAGGLYLFEVTKARTGTDKKEVKVEALQVSKAVPRYTTSTMFMEAEAFYTATFKINAGGTNQNYFTEFTGMGSHIETVFNVAKDGTPVSAADLNQANFKVWRATEQEENPGQYVTVTPLSPAGTVEKNIGAFIVTDKSAQLGERYTYYFCYTIDGEEYWGSETVNGMPYFNSSLSQPNMRHLEKAAEQKTGIGTIGMDTNRNLEFEFVTSITSASGEVDYTVAGTYSAELFSSVHSSSPWQAKIEVEVKD